MWSLGLLYVIMLVKVDTDFAMTLNTAHGSISITLFLPCPVLQSVIFYKP